MGRTSTDITWDERTAAAAKWYSNMSMKERTNIFMYVQNAANIFIEIWARS